MDDLKFNQSGLIPVIVQDYQTGEVRMLAYANREALDKTLESGYAHYYSRSRGELWKKGETSGNLQQVVKIRRDCDRDTLIYFVRQQGAACHTGKRNCFFEEYDFEAGAWKEVDPFPPGSIAAILGELEAVIERRQDERPDGSYTVELLEGTPDKDSLDLVLEKIGEEAVELLLAAKNNDAAELSAETADLLYHLLVLLRSRDLDLSEVAGVLEERRG